MMTLGWLLLMVLVAGVVVGVAHLVRRPRRSPSEEFARQAARQLDLAAKAALKERPGLVEEHLELANKLMDQSFRELERGR